MALKIQAPITVNAYDKKFVEGAVAEMRDMLAATNARCDRIEAMLTRLFADEDTVARLTEEARINRQAFERLGTKLNDATPTQGE